MIQLVRARNGEEGGGTHLVWSAKQYTAFFGHIRNDATKGWGAHIWLLDGGGKVKRVSKTQGVRFGDGTEQEYQFN